MTVKSIEQVEELLTTMQQKLHYCQDKKQTAQAIAFDLLIADKDKPKFEEIKADAFNAMQELKKIVVQRDKLKAHNKELRKENRIMRETLNLKEKDYEKEIDVQSS